MIKYTPEHIYEFANKLQGEVTNNSYGKHTNTELAYMPLRFEKWWFTSWFDFKEQTAHSPIYWFNKKPRGGFQMTVGGYGMPICEFLELIKEIVNTNSLRIESREEFINSRE